MTKSLKNKRILFIGAKTFNYEKEIIKCLQSMGAIVDYFNDRPFEVSYKKILLRLAPKLMKKEVNQYFLSILNKASENKYDYVFCIKLECCPRVILEQLKAQQKQAEFIFYTWDSFVNNGNPLNSMDIFDRTLTFDHKDAIEYGLIHRPLFYLDEYAALDEQQVKYDVIFIGSVHIHRYKKIKQFLRVINTKYNCFLYLFVPSKLLYLARKFLLFPVYGMSKETDFQFLPLTQNEIINLFGASKAILDFSHHNQSGLTMRTIEALGAQRKLITDNVNVKTYDFFNVENILVIDEANFNIPNNFLDSAYVSTDKYIYERYSLTGWIQEVFNLQK
jgi:hypothetical protein